MVEALSDIQKNGVSAFTAGASGGGNSGVAEVDFGAGSSMAKVTVTGATFLTSNTKLVASPSGESTTDNGTDEYWLQFVSAYCTNINIGASTFDVVAHAPNRATGKFKINWIGVDS